MISKNSRRATGSVEQLKQSSFTGAKGIDETAPALAPDSVLHLKNLDVDTDGGLILRKPLKAVRTFPNVQGKAPVFTIPFQDAYTLLIYQNEDACVLGVVNSDNEAVALNLGWIDYQTRAERSVPSTNLEACESTTVTGLSSGVFYKTNFFSFDNLTYANLATTLLIYGTLVDCTHPVFEGTLAREDLYSGADTKLPRVLQIYYDSSILSVTLNIAYSEMSDIRFGDDVPLDVNLNLDNPYAIRDGYAQLSSTIKGILPYVPATYKYGKVTHRVSYGNEAVVGSLSNVHTFGNNVTDITAGQIYLNYATKFALFKPLYFTLSQYNILGAQFENNVEIATETPYDAHVVRAGTLFCKFPPQGIEISYFLDDTGQYVSYDTDSDTLQAAYDEIPHVQFSPLCKVTCDVRADILQADKNEAPAVTVFNANGIRLTIPLDISFHNKNMQNYIVKDVTFSSVMPSGTAFTTQVPKCVSDFIYPPKWLDITAPSSPATLKNFIPLVVSLTCGFRELMVEPYHGVFRSWKYTWRTSENEPYMYSNCGNVRTFVSKNNLYICFTRAHLYSNTQSLEDAKGLFLKIPKQAVDAFQIGISNMIVQGYPEFSCKYTSDFGISDLETTD